MCGLRGPPTQGRDAQTWAEQEAAAPLPLPLALRDRACHLGATTLEKLMSGHPPTWLSL